jgi:hypothetical protein
VIAVLQRCAGILQQISNALLSFEHGRRPGRLAAQPAIPLRHVVAPVKPRHRLR